MRKIEVSEIEKELNYLITNEIEDVMYCIHKKPLVFRSASNDVADDYCIQNNIDVCKSFNMGGTIVANTGDIDMAILLREGWNIGKYFLQHIKKILENKISDLTIDGNDLLVDNKYKIVSYASINAKNRLIYTCVHISLNPDIELINNICRKTMSKIPKGLTDFNISTNNMEEIILKIDYKKLQGEE